MILAFHITKAGAVLAVPNTAPDDYPPKGDYIWLHFDANDPATETWLTTDKAVDSLAATNLLAGDSRPRTMVHDGAVLINLRGINLNPKSDPEDMVGIRFFIEKNRIISVERRPLKATGDIVVGLKSQSPPRTVGEFLTRFTQSLIERLNPTIIELNERVDDLEERADSKEGLTDKASLSELRRQAILLRRYLAPQRDALNALITQPVKFISEEERLRLRDCADQSTRVTEELDAIRERCAVVKDQLTDQRAEDMNRNMMILSVVAAIFLPLGLISGMMGINVGGMPWTESANGFWYVTAIVLIIGLIQLLVFRLLKWL